MRKKILKCISLVALSIFIFTNGTKALAADNYHTLYDSPEPNYVDLVFSVAKGETNDQTTNGMRYDGRPYGDYDQIHTDPNKSGNNGRYAIHNVSGSAIAVNITNIIGGDATNLNETLLSEEYNMAVEEVLQNYLGTNFDDACLIAAQYIAANRELNIENYRETWFIDWYVIKYQRENGGRIHVDGKYVEFPTIEEPIEEEPEEEPIITEPEIADDLEEEEEPVVPEEKPEVIITPSLTTIPPVIFIIPPFVEEITDMPTPTPSPEPTATPTEAPAEIIDDITPVDTPEGTPVEEIDDLTPVEMPQGAPEEEEEEIPIELPEVPEGDVLPQTGAASSATFYEIGLFTILLGLFTFKKGKRFI